MTLASIREPKPLPWPTRHGSGSQLPFHSRLHHNVVVWPSRAYDVRSVAAAQRCHFEAFIPDGRRPAVSADRATPLASTGLPIGNGPGALRTSVTLMLQSPVPIVTLLGRERLMIYNDTYSRFVGERHPSLLGSNFRRLGEIASFNDNVVSTCCWATSRCPKPSINNPHV